MEDTKKLLQKIEGYEKIMPSTPPENDQQMVILYDMVQQVKTQTDNYTKPEGISTIEVDVRPILTREKVDADKWIKKKGRLSRSEKESLEWLIDELNRKLTGQPGKTKSSEDDDELMLMEMEAEALALELELLEL